jgi:long-chain fatty acid transport protein
MKRIGLATAAVLAFLAAAANGEDGRYRSYIIGERAAGMGGAAVAIGSGVDAAYYNPAGLANAEKDSLSLTANLYGIQEEKVDSAFYPDDDINSRSVATIPASISLVRRMNEQMVLGFSVLEPDYHTCDEILTRGHGKHLYNYSANEKSLWFGPSAAWKCDNGISIGLSVFGTYNYNKEDISLTLNEYDVTVRQAFKEHSVDLLALFGVQWRSEEGWAAGASVQTPSLHLWDSATLAMTQLGQSFYSDDLDAEHRLPFQIAIGVGRQVAREYGFGLDVTYHPSMSYTALGVNDEYAGLEDQKLSRKQVVDFSLGGEYYFAGQYPLRGGVYTAFSAADDIEDSREIATRDVDLYGATLSIGRENDLMGINVGLNYVIGRGHDIGYDGNQNSCRRRAREQQLYLTFNTTYYF